LEISDVKELLAPELRQTKADRKSQSRRAERQGMMMVLSGFAVILILAILRDFVTVPKSLFALSVLIFIIGGAVRMSMPSLFRKNDAAEGKNNLPAEDLETNKLSGDGLFKKSLPEAEYRPPLNFGAKGLETNELIPISSVTENTTKNLGKEFQPEP
jgi:hypothetical protein